MIQTKDPEVISLVGLSLDSNIARKVALKHDKELTAFYYNFIRFCEPVKVRVNHSKYSDWIHFQSRNGAYYAIEFRDLQDFIKFYEEECGESN